MQVAAPDAPREGATRVIRVVMRTPSGSICRWWSKVARSWP